jgi:pyruvate dehydrogenase complex dehydrogenase (E1) component
VTELTNSESSAEDLQALLAEDKREWLEAIDAIYSEFGAGGVREILRSVQDHVLSRNVPLDEATLNTPYINSIAPEDQPIYPGDVEIEERIEKNTALERHSHGATGARQRYWCGRPHRHLCVLCDDARGWL